MNSILNLIRNDLLNFNSYSSARSEAKTGRIWFNANELPWGNCNQLEEVSLNRYPDKQPEILINKLASYYSVDPNQILVTRGSDEGIDLLVRLLCNPNQDGILICSPSFGMYEVSAKLQGAQVIRVALMEDNFDLDIDQVLSQWSSKIKLIFLCSPNNPTGNLISTNKIIRLCQELIGKSIVVVDEAYIEFSKSNSLSIYINELSNLVILRTLSKAFGLAGLRVGALLANKLTINWLRKILPPYPLPVPSIKTTINALESDSLLDMKKKIDIIISERDLLIESLQKLKIVKKVWPSKSNFIFVVFNRSIYEECNKRGFVLRNMETRTKITNSMRITVGKPIENTELINMLGKL